MMAYPQPPVMMPPPAQPTVTQAAIKKASTAGIVFWSLAIISLIALVIIFYKELFDWAADSSGSSPDVYEKVIKSPAFSLILIVFILSSLGNFCTSIAVAVLCNRAKEAGYSNFSTPYVLAIVGIFIFMVSLIAYCSAKKNAKNLMYPPYPTMPMPYPMPPQYGQPGPAPVSPQYGQPSPMPVPPTTPQAPTTPQTPTPAQDAQKTS